MCDFVCFLEDKNEKSSVKYLQTWLDLDSIKDLIPILKETNPSVISMDLDGNDFYFVKEILKNELLPIIFICEYNAFLGPNVEFVQSYNKTHIWDESNYYGASLKSYTNLFDLYGYTLVACNLTGVNAYFIRNDHIDKFKDISRITDELYVYGPISSITSDQGLNNIKVIQEILSNSHLPDMLITK